MKKLLKPSLALLLFVIIFSLSACGEKEAKKNVTSESNLGNESTQSVENTQIPLQNNIANAYDFSDGKAFVILEDSKKRMFIDNTGKELFSIKDDQMPYTQFFNGVFIISNTHQEPKDMPYGSTIAPDMLINAKNEIIASPEKQGYSLFCVEQIEEGKQFNTHALLADGYILAYKKSESFEGIKIELGVLNTKGEWTVPLSTDNPISKFVAKNGEDVSLKYEYLGDGVICFESEFEYGSQFYNIKDNYWFTIGFKTRGLISQINFDNGVTVISDFDGNIYMLTNRGATTKFNGDELKVENAIIDYSSGLFFYNNGFYNSSGVKEIDLSKYTIIEHSNMHFEGDNAIIGIVNSAGSYYYTVIDKTGKFLFEPIEMGFSGILSEEIISYSNNIFIYQTGLAKDKNSKDVVVLDEKGNKKFILPHSETDTLFNGIYLFKYSDGLARVHDLGTKSQYYVDINGKRVIG